MTDLSRAMSEIKSLPDEALKKELAMPTGMVPGYLIMSELQDRQALRNGSGPKRPLSMAQEMLQGFTPQPAQRMYAEGGLIAATNPFIALIESLQNPEKAGQIQQETINAKFAGQPPLMPLQPLGNPSPVPDIQNMNPQQPGRPLTPDAVGGIANLLR